MPWRRLRMISSRCCCSGRPLTSTTLSSMRVNTRTTSLYSSQSKRGLVGERVAHELGQVDRAEQAGAVGRQRLLAAGIGGADVLAPPVVVHLVDPVDQDETRLGEVVGRGHDPVPQLPRADVAVDLAGHQAVVAGDVVRVCRPVAPDDLGRRRRGRPRPASLRLTGNTSGQSASFSTASMNSSVISSDRLNWRRRPSSRLARMNSFTSGCETSKVPICAPRRPPAEDTVKHILS